ncbi:MAG: OmpA family protein [Ghiorsea sp.]
MLKNKNTGFRSYEFDDESDALEPLSTSGNDSWMVAYLDLMTLLLALFIVMGAISHSKAGISLQGQSVVEKDSAQQGVPKTLDATVERQDKKEGMAEELNKIIGNNALGGVMSIKASPGLIRLQMKAKLLFPIGQADMSTAGVEAVQKVAELFKEHATTIEVEGHSDNVPISGGPYPSNWSLSAARAVSVVEKLIEYGVPATKLHATGYADTKPLTSNLTAEGRAKNRRVEFVVEMGSQHNK